MRFKLMEFSREVSVVFMNHCVLMAIFVTLSGMMESLTDMTLYWALLVFLPIYQYLVRKYVDNFFFFFVLHLIWPVVLFNLRYPDGIFGMLFALLSFVYVIISVKTKMTEGDEEEDYIPPVVGVILIGVAFWLQGGYGNPKWTGLYLWLVLIYLTCYFLHKFMDAFLRFVFVNKFSASNIPEREIFASGIRQTLLFVGGGVLVLLLTANIEWFAYLARMLGRGILAVLHAILPPLQKSQESGFTMEEGGNGAGNGAGMDFGEVQSSPFWEFMERLMVIATVIFLLCAAIYGLYRLARYLWTNFHNKKQGVELVINSNMDVREVCAVEKRQKGSIRRLLFPDNRGKVRQAYKKYILKSKSELLPEDAADHRLGYLTAAECCEKLSAEVLQEVYEKARYGFADVTAEDVKLARNYRK